MSGGPPPPPPPPLPPVGSNLKKRSSDAAPATKPVEKKNVSSGSGPFGFDPSKVVLKKTGKIVLIIDCD